MLPISAQFSDIKETNAAPNRYTSTMRSKVFWISFTILGLIASVVLPLMWGIIATVPLLFICWWFAYRTEWFDD